MDFDITRPGFLILLEEILESGGCVVEGGPLSELLVQCGLTHATTHKFYSAEVILRLVDFSRASPDEQALAMDLPAESPLRKFYESVLRKNPLGKVAPLIQILEAHYKFTRKKRLNPQSEPLSEQLGALLYQKLRSEFHPEHLGSWKHRLGPERIVSPVSLDLAAGRYELLGGDELAKRRAYEVLAKACLQGVPNNIEKKTAEAAAVAHGISERSLPATWAWLKLHAARFNLSHPSPPPAFPCQVILHIGSGDRIRAELTCLVKVERALTESIANSFVAALKHLGYGEDITVSGPVAWSPVKRKHWAASRTLSLTPNMPTPGRVDKAYEFVCETWKRYQLASEIVMGKT